MGPVGMPHLPVLFRCWLLFRIVACPCLSGESFHDWSSLAFYRWAGAATIPSDDLSDPFSVPDLGPCICDGAPTSTCSPCWQADRSGELLAEWAIPLTQSVDRPDAGLDARLVTRTRQRDALAVRAVLQNFRC
jgi:hypothetical protein